jgi:DNA repair protein RecN (Recombination protein N)
MSRFLLALKACFSQIDPVATFVFDEVDTGVSGRIAQAIAEMLHRLSQNHQILCVTHQPIIAAMADHHFHVEKRVIAAETEANGAPTEATAERTVIRIHPLAEQQRPLALAQLAGGGTTEQMLAFANSLLQQAAQIRQAAVNGSPSSPKTKRTRRNSTPQAS